MSGTTETPETSFVEWVTLEDATNHQQIKCLIPTLRAWYWELYKPQFKRRMVEAGAMLKVGKSWRVSLTKAPSVIEDIYREQSLAALDRGSPSQNPQRRSANRAGKIVCA